MIALVMVALLAQSQATPRDARPAAATGTATIAGVVTTDETTPRPLRRARVTLNGASVEIGRTAITADDGSFVFDRLPAGRFEIAAAKDAYISMNYGATRPGRPGARVAVAARDTARIAIRLPRGAVITGTVVDVDGLPAQAVRVSALLRRVSRSAFADVQYLDAGTPTPGLTDDRGVYRIYGLPAGDYIVATRAFPGPPPGTTGSIVQVMSGGKLGTRKMLLSDVYHPGSADLARAARVTVRAGEERGGVDIQLEYVPLATITGTVNVPAAYAPPRLTLWRMDEETRPPNGPVTSADALGRFQFPMVAPGRYRITARAVPASAAPEGRGSAPPPDVMFAIADLVVNGEDVDVPMAAEAGVTISGRVVFESDRATPPALPTSFRINTPQFVTSTRGGWPLPPIVLEGTRFRMEGVIPGAYRITPNAQGIRAPIGGWWLKSIVIGGRDILDAPLDPGQGADHGVVTFTDRASEVTGTLKDAQGAPVADAMAIVFSSDRATWFFNSRRIAAVRADRNGSYSIRNLPPGDYCIVAATDLEQNEWFDPSVLERLTPSAGQIAIAGTEKITHDLLVR